MVDYCQMIVEKLKKRGKSGDSKKIMFDGPISAFYLDALIACGVNMMYHGPAYCDTENKYIVVFLVI